MTKIPSLPAILGRDGCSESSTNRPIFCSEKISNDMPLFAHGDAARCHGSAPCKSPDLRSEGEEKSLLAYTSSLLTEQVPQWWTLVPAGDGASPASVCPCAHSAGRAGLCTPFISSRRLTLLRGPLQQNGYTVSMSQLKHSIVAFIVLEWRCKVNGFEGGEEKKEGTQRRVHTDCSNKLDYKSTHPGRRLLFRAPWMGAFLFCRMF